MRIALIDNYDSFTFNVVHALAKEGAEVEVFRNDAMSADELIALGHDAIVVSPGPCTPSEAGISVDVIEKANGKVPLLGVCLGHQAMGQLLAGMSSAPTPCMARCRRSGTTARACFAA